MILLKRILVATDFSDTSKVALTYGRALARTFDATLHVVHVVDNLSAAIYGIDGYGAAMPPVQADLEDAARQRLADLLVDHDEHPLPTQQVVLTSNAVAATIADYAAQERIDLIVTGTHGRGAMAHLLLGNVAERIVRTAPCPVLTVRQPKHEFVTSDTLTSSTHAPENATAAAR